MIVHAPGPVVCITQARMGSTRLPAKVMREIRGKPLLWWHLTRLQRAHRVDRIVVATTAGAEADPIVALAEGLGIAVFRGDEHDVLARFAGAAEMAGAETVVRVTSDCPLIDPALIDAVIEFYGSLQPETRYASLDVSRYPRGLDVEVFARGALDEAMAEAHDPADREHVTPYLWRRPERFGLRQLSHGIEAGHYRLCVDEAADLDLVTRLISYLAPLNAHFGWRHCVEALEAHPEWAAINGSVAQKSVFTERFSC